MTGTTPVSTASWGKSSSLILAGVVVEALLIFVWSITGTIALRNGLLVVLLGMLPFLCVDWALWRRSLAQPGALLLAMLSAWIILHNLLIAWEPARAWYESQQWFKSVICLGLGVALVCAPRDQSGASRWRVWMPGIAAAWGLHLILNIVLKDWTSAPIASVMQEGTRIGTRDMVSYLGTGLLAILLADVAGRLAGVRAVLAFLPGRALYLSTVAVVLLTTATLTRNAMPIMALEILMAVVAVIVASATRAQRLRRGGVLAAILVVVMGVFALNVALDSRWKNLADSARIAWDIDGNNWWMDEVHNPRPVNAQGVPVDHSAYSRVAWLRGAWRMLEHYPLGTGYDRNAFRRALLRYYGPIESPPGHAHAGLVDFTLGTGIPGGLLLVAGMGAMIVSGWRRWHATRNVAGLMLALFAASYLCRAAIDGIVRDHMLEQALFVMGVMLAASMTQESRRAA